MTGPRLRSRGLAVACLLLCVAVTGCAEPATSHSGSQALELVVTMVPAGSARPGTAAHFDPGARYPRGSRVALVSTGAGSEVERVLSGTLIAAGAPALSRPADKILFAGRRGPESNFAIFEAGLSRGRPSLVLDTGLDCVDPAYLPDDRLVMSCVDSADSPIRSLYTASRDGTGIERITFGPRSAFDPLPLEDGRILFSMQQGPGIGREEDAVALFTLNPDGTLLEAFSGSHESGARRSRPRQTDDGGVVVARSSQGDSRARVERVEMGRPQHSAGYSSAGLDVLTVEPLRGDELLITGYPSAIRHVPAAAYRWRSGDVAAWSVFGLEDWDVIEAVPKLIRPPLRSRPTAVDHERETATLLCYDAGRSDGRVGPPKEGITPGRVAVSRMRRSARGWSVDALGTVSIDDDHSFLIEVPADVPLRIETLSSDGSSIAQSDWFWLRPGEVRSCFGCHESRQMAPVNHLAQALSSPVQQLAPADEEFGQ